MDTLLKHNKETEEWFDDKFGLALISLIGNGNNIAGKISYDLIKSFITLQNTELLKKIAKGEIESIKKDIKHWAEYSAGTYQQGGIEQAKYSLFRWQQVLEDLEK